jgi:hypothetical protein
MKNFLISYKDKIIGVYTNFDKAKLFIHSCLSNNLMTGSADILVYKKNSCHCINIINITLETKPIEKENKPIEKENKPIEKENKLIIKENKLIEKEIDYNNPEYIKLAEDKNILQHKINMLKVQKERIKESKEIFDNDIILFNKFKNNIIEDSNFIIPELFKDKFLIFKNLEYENKLNWENFIKEYNHNNIYTDYFNSNSYDDSFVENGKKNNINIEFEIPSDTESSDAE